MFTPLYTTKAWRKTGSIQEYSKRLHFEPQLSYFAQIGQGCFRLLSCFAQIGPFELDPATRRSLDNALGLGGSRQKKIEKAQDLLQ